MSFEVFRITLQLICKIYKLKRKTHVKIVFVNISFITDLVSQILTFTVFKGIKYIENKNVGM